MNILVLGGTRFFGIHMVNELLKMGHEVTIATRGNVQDEWGNRVKHIVLDRTNAESMQKALIGMHFDVVIDKLAYCSNDIKYALEVLDCDKYIHMSSTAVYEPKHIDTREEEFNGADKKLIWCNRMDFAYDEVKRQAECALCQIYDKQNWIAVRYPFVIGADDYTKRLLFYVEHTIKAIPMHIDNIDAQMGFIRSDEAGKFMAFLVDKDVRGAINGCSQGTISLREIIEYVERNTGTKAVITAAGEPAPYNGEMQYSINTEKAQALGFQFTELKDWIFKLLDDYISQFNDH